MKKIVIIILANLFIITSLMAQNNIWSLPPNYYQFPTGPVQPLPAPGGFVGTGGVPNYAGLPSEFTHNAMQDANGDLLFFIVDGMIYDKEGYGINGIRTAAGAINLYKGFSETAIVPVPGNCNQYYIIATDINTNNNHYSPRIKYALLDLSLISWDTQRKGVLFNPNNLPYQADFTSPTLFELDVFAPGYLSGSTAREGLGGFSITKLRSDNTRFLYFTGETDIYRFEISASGIAYDGLFNFSPSIFPNTPNISDRSTRTEMEIIETTTGYRLAFAYPSFSCNTCTPVIPGGVSLFVAELNNAGDVVSTSTGTLAETNNGGIPNIKGIEFSPNGDYVYITHHITNLHPSPFKIYDVVAQNFIMPSLISPAFQNEILAYEYSRIELGSDGKLYFANSNGLATLSNSNNPSALSWNNSAIPVNYNLSTYNFPLSQNPVLFLYALPDQIDGMDYTESFFIDAACCKENTNYNVAISDNTHEYNTNTTWSYGVGNNPWNVTTTQDVTIKDQLVIKSGTNITINGMTLKFAPNAQLVIEDGAGLTINNTILTVDDRCDPNAMWHGVEVWGNGTFQPATSGKFIAQNNSLIEHALEATANYKHDLTTGVPIVGSVVIGSTGGAILLTNTKLRNNQYDVYMETFQSALPNGFAINDQTTFNNCEFVTDGLLNDPAILPIDHANLNYVNGIRFLNCKFQNTAPINTFAYLSRGTGIRTQDTKFTVEKNTTLLTSEFNNLTRGIDSQTNNPIKTTSITNTTFYDNWRCIFLRNLDLANVSNNTFDIGEYNVFSGSGVSFGLVVWDCDKYKVENNAFLTSFNGYLGCGVINSLTGMNEIYKNTFTDLVIGCQAAGINGDESNANATGLEFRCNEYYNGIGHDILVSSGEVKTFQGSCVNQLSPVNNQFSYTTTAGDFWLDNIVTANHNYIYSPNGINLAPRVGFYPTSVPFVTLSPCNNLPSFNPAVSCPTRANSSPLQLKSTISANQTIVDGLESQIDGGDTQAILNLVATTSGVDLKNDLMAASPYLSDDVLLAYIATNPSIGNLKLVLLANSPLSEAVMLAVNGLGLPKGSKKAINNAQTGVSPRQNLGISYYKSLIERGNNDILRKLVFATGTTKEIFKNVASFIENMPNKTNNDKQLLINALMASGDYVGAQQALLQMHNNPKNANFCKLKNTLIACQQFPEKEMVLVTNMTLQQAINEVATATTNGQEVASAQILKEQIGLTLATIEEIEIVTTVNLRKSQVEEKDEKEELIIQASKINLYPNPTQEQFTITHNLLSENGVIIITIYDVMGKDVFNKKITEKNQVVNINTLGSGMYFYSITQNNITIKTDKLIVR